MLDKKISRSYVLRTALCYAHNSADSSDFHVRYAHTMRKQRKFFNLALLRLQKINFACQTKSWRSVLAVQVHDG